MIKVGDPLPAVSLAEYSEVEGNGCSIGPNPVDVQQAAAGKTIAVFAVPGAFTPTCSAKHVPSYLQNYDALKAAGVDEIWCLSVNDPFVMGAWEKASGVDGKIVFLADPDAAFSTALDLTFDGSAAGLGVRSKRYSMLVEDGVVKALNIEESPGQATVSGGAAMIEQL